MNELNNSINSLDVRMDAFIEFPILIKYIDYQNPKIFPEIIKIVKLNRLCLDYIDDDVLKERIETEINK